MKKPKKPRFSYLKNLGFLKTCQTALPCTWVGSGQEYGLVPVFKKFAAGFCPSAAKMEVTTWEEEVRGIGGGRFVGVDLVPGTAAV